MQHPARHHTGAQSQASTQGAVQMNKWRSDECNAMSRFFRSAVPDTAFGAKSRSESVHSHAASHHIKSHHDEEPAPSPWEEAEFRARSHHQQSAASADGSGQHLLVLGVVTKGTVEQNQ